MNRTHFVIGLVIICGALLLAFLPDNGQSFQDDILRPGDASEKGLGETYTNTRYRFSLSYPPELSVRVYEEPHNSQTLVFDDGKEKSFQIFITPYAETEISERRFLMDAPSGVRENPVEIFVGGERATMFFSKHALLGDTREVWFIHNGFLYEVTTYRKLDGWLSGIMSTWKFL